MTFKQFRRWCEDRACDGYWGFNDALYCVELVQNMLEIPWWKRRRTWKKIEIQVLCAVVTPINQKRQEMAAKMDGDGNE